MPQIKSAKKELRKGSRREERNSAVKNELSLMIKKVRKAITDGSEAVAREALKSALKSLDKATQKGVLKKNTRDRKKSRLHKAVNKIAKK